MRPAWVTDDLAISARDMAAEGATIRDMAAELGLSYYRARELARLVEGTAPPSTSLVIGDLHIPYHDTAAVGAVMEWASLHQPDYVYLNGDLLDCYAISKFAQPGSRGRGFPAEVEAGVVFLEQLRETVPEAVITLLEGNHEFRLRHFLNNEGAALKGLKGLTMRDQLDLDRLGVRYVECPGERWWSTTAQAYPDLVVGHFDRVAPWAGYTAKAIMDRQAVSFVTGHIHSAGVHHRTMAAGTVWGYEGGCLCDLHPHYTDPTSWAHALTVAHHREGVTRVEHIHLVDGAFYYGGRLYGAAGRTT